MEDLIVINRLSDHWIESIKLIARSTTAQRQRSTALTIFAWTVIKVQYLNIEGIAPRTFLVPEGKA